MTLVKIKVDELSKMSVKELISLGRQGLKMARQQQRRLLESGYELSHNQKLFNKTFKTPQFTQKQTRQQILSNVAYIKRHLESGENVAGRVELQRQELKMFQKYYSDNDEDFTFRKGKGGVWNITHEGVKDVITRQELSDFWDIYNEFKDYFLMKDEKYIAYAQAVITTFVKDRKTKTVHEMMGFLNGRLQEIYEKEFKGL